MKTKAYSLLILLINTICNAQIDIQDYRSNQKDSSYSFQEIQKTRLVRSVKSSDFNTGNINNPIELITGKIPGLVTSRPGSNPNEGTDVRLRSINSVYCNISPLIVIDNIKGGNFDNVSSYDIESITVMNSGEASTLYGSAGSAGVIQVKTKIGQAGKPVIEYNANTSTEMLARSAPSMNPRQWRHLRSELNLGTDLGHETDWFRELTGTAISHRHNIGISGGIKKTDYRFSFDYNDINGIMTGKGYNQLTGRFNLSQRVFKERLKLDLNMDASDRKSDYGFTEAFKYASIYNPTAPVRSNDPARYEGYYQQVLFDYYNPVAINNLNRNEGRNQSINLAFSGTGNIIEGLSLSALYVFASNKHLGEKFFNPKDYWGMRSFQSRQYNYFTNNYTELKLNFEKSIRSFRLSAIAGVSKGMQSGVATSARGEAFLNENFTFRNYEKGFILENGKNPSSEYKNTIHELSAFSQISMSINSILTMTAGARYEGTSLFAHSERQLFPSAGAEADLTKLLRTDKLQNLIIHAGYAVSGNRPSYYGFIGNRSSSWYFDGNYSIQPWSTQFNLDPEWEKKKEFETGICITSHDLTLSIDYYLNKTNDLFLKILSPSTSFVNTILFNIGKLTSSGIESSLSLNNLISKKNLKYSINFTASKMLKNEFSSLRMNYNGMELSLGPSGFGSMGAPSQHNIPLNMVEEGKPVGQLIAMVYNGVDAMGNMIFEDNNKDGIINYMDRMIAGNGLPKFHLGLDNQILYKKWDLNFLFLSILGHKLINTYRALYEVPFLISSYNLPESTADIRNELTRVYARNTSGTFSDYHIENASFISLHNLSLGYNFRLPENSAFDLLKVYFAGNNLFYISKYSGADPNPRYTDKSLEPENYGDPVFGVDRINSWPRTRSFSIGIKVIL